MVSLKLASPYSYSDVRSHMWCMKYDLVCDSNTVEYVKAVAVAK